MLNTDTSFILSQSHQEASIIISTRQYFTISLHANHENTSESDGREADRHETKIICVCGRRRKEGIGGEIVQEFNELYNLQYAFSFVYGASA